MNDVNQSIVSALAKKLVDGTVTVEEASKLLNTVARFEERCNNLNSSSDRPVKLDDPVIR